MYNQYHKYTPNDIYVLQGPKEVVLYIYIYKQCLYLVLIFVHVNSLQSKVCNIHRELEYQFNPLEM